MTTWPDVALVLIFVIGGVIRDASCRTNIKRNVGSTCAEKENVL